MANFYNKIADEVIVKDEHHSGLKIKITKYATSFNIDIYKGRFKVVFVYRSPYQRKYGDYKSLISEKRRRELSNFESEAFELIFLEEKSLMEEYKEKFKSMLSEHPNPSYPISKI